MFIRADRALAQLPRLSIIGLALAGLALAGAIDYLTGYEASVSLFYLVPVSTASWYADRRAGVVFAVAASLVSYAAEVTSGYTSVHPLIPIWNTSIRLSFFLIIALLLSLLRERLFAEKRLARIDALTGLLNSRGFAEQLLHDLALAERLGQPMTLVYVDVDDFKVINDTYGHSEGDRVLRTIGQTLIEGSRRADTVARVGGDEFTLILPATDLAGAEILIGKLRERLDASLARGLCSATCSIGAVEFRERPGGIDEAIAAADRLMYDAKIKGKNAGVFRVYSRPADARSEPSAGPDGPRGRDP